MLWIAIIAGVLIVAFGPIMWLRPTKKDRRLAALRERARAIGFAMDVKSLPRLDPAPEERVSAGGRVRDAKQLVPVYQWLLARRLANLDAFRILRGPEPDALSRGAVAVAEGWYFDPDQSYPPRGWSTVAATLVEHLASLPADVVAVALEPRQIALYWLESVGNDAQTVDRLKDWLVALEAALQTVSGASQPSAEGPADENAP